MPEVVEVEAHLPQEEMELAQVAVMEVMEFLLQLQVVPQLVQVVAVEELIQEFIHQQLEDLVELEAVETEV